MKKVLVVENRNAGRKKAVKYKKQLIKILLSQNIYFKSIGIEAINDSVISDFDTVIVIGGDGTVNKLIPYIINTEIKLGIIPCGTANLLAAKLGISTNIKQAIEIIASNNFTSVDTFKINEYYSVLRLGLGYDADIICKTPQSLKNRFGYFAYFISGILFALRLKQKKYVISFNGKKISIKATCIIAANAGNMFRNIFSISQKCNLCDGLMDVFILKVKNPFLFFFEFLQIIFDKKVSNTKALYFQTPNLVIKNDFVTGHIDGEKQKFKGDIEISIAPRSVKILCHNNY